MTPEALERAIATPESAEQNIASLGEDTDPGDIFTVLAVIADHYEMTVTDFITNDRLARELLSATQSNYERSWDLLTEMAQIADALTEKG